MTEVFTTVLGMSLAAVIAAAVVLLLRLALRKAPKVFSYILWAVVFFRLLVPVTLQSPFGIMPSDTGTLPKRILYQQDSESAGRRISAADDTTEDAVQSSAASTLSSQGNPVPANKTQHKSHDSAVTGTRPNLTYIGAMLWLIGCIALLGYSVFHYLRLSHRLKSAVRLADGVFESDRISTAFVLGILHPVIYVPTRMPPAQLDFILRHERTHIRRRDYLVKLLAFFALALHWFNPAVWLSYFLMCKDMEMSCDESVLQRFGGDIRRDYSNALLNLSIRRAGLLLPLAFGENNVRARIKNILRYRKPGAWSAVFAAVLVTVIMAGCMSDRKPTPDPVPVTSVVDSSPDMSSEEPAGGVANDPDPAAPTDEPDPLVLKYYNYFLEHHSLTDNIIFTVDENTLQDEVMYFAFMNTDPIDGNPENIRTKKQIDDVVEKYFSIKPKRYSTGRTRVTSDGKVDLFSSCTWIRQHNRLLLKKLTDNGDGSFSAVFKLYQITADSAPVDFDAYILSGDTEMEGYYTMDVDTVFSEKPEGDSYYLRFEKFTLIPREGEFAPPPQETDYSKKVAPEEFISYHGLSIGMTLDEAQKILKLPENAYEFQEDNYADYIMVNADGWQYNFRTRPKEETSDRTQYLWSVNIREYQDVLFRDIKLGDTYEDVIKKFPAASEDGQTLGAPDSYATRDYVFATTLRSVDVFTGSVHFSMTFGRYGTLVWVDIYAIDV